MELSNDEVRFLNENIVLHLFSFKTPILNENNGIGGI